ncbi:MAG: hypothetical protein VB934_13145, partial [Polyangiaceae bacterium]
ANNPAAALVLLEQAVELEPTNDEWAALVEQQYHAQERYPAQAAFLVKRSAALEGELALATRHRAVQILLSVGDDQQAGEVLASILEAEEDKLALQLQLDIAERGSANEDVRAALKRLTALCEGEEKLAYAAKEAQFLAEVANDLPAAVACYQSILDDIDDKSAFALYALADIHAKLEDHEAAASAYARLLELDNVGEKAPLACRLAELYEGPLDDAEKALTWYERFREWVPEDATVLPKMESLAEKLEDWEKVANALTEQLGQQGSEAEGVRLALKLAAVLNDKLERGQDALSALEGRADQGDELCREAYAGYGLAADWKGIVATKLVEWNETTIGDNRKDALGRAFALFIEVEREADARTVALDLLRSGDASAEMIAKLEEITVRLKDLDGLASVHALMAKELEGEERAAEFIRQAGVMIEAGAGGVDAIQHGEAGLIGLEADVVEGVLAQIAGLTEAPGHIIDLYERQVGRAKKSQDRVQLLSLAAQVAAKHGALDRARGFLSSALTGGVHEDALATLESAARGVDEDNVLLSAFAEALAAGGKGSRDGGRTRSALLRRAASIAQRDLGDVDRAFEWMTGALVAHVDETSLDALGGLGREVADMSRVEQALGVALDKVHDGPLVRMLLRFRASLRQEHLNDDAGAAVDLKRLHDLSPSDQALTKELSSLLTALEDHRGMIELYEDQILRGREPHVRAELARKVARIWESDIGDAREAADAWRRVLRMKAGDKEAVAGLERAKAGKLKKAPPVRNSVAPPPPPSIAPPSVTKAPTPEELAVLEDADQGPAAEAEADFADTTAEMPAMDLEATAALLGATGGDQQDVAAYAGSMASPEPPAMASPEPPA